jgi:hypothetical protein
MKKLLIGLLALSCFSTFAGEITNRKTNETIKFSLENGQLIIDGSLAGLPLHQIPVEESESKINSRVKYVGSPDSLYVITSEIADEFNPIGIVLSFALETVVLPVRAPVYVVKTKQMKNDIDLIKKTISSSEVVFINDSQFNRISRYFNY